MSAGNGSDTDDFTPPEAYPLTHPGNREPCRVLADLTMRMNERTRKLESLRHEIAADPRPLGREGWGRIADHLDGDAAESINAATELRRVVK